MTTFGHHKIGETFHFRTYLWKLMNTIERNYPWKAGDMRGQGIPETAYIYIYGQHQGMDRSKH